MRNGKDEAFLHFSVAFYVSIVYDETANGKRSGTNKIDAG
jgi:hypothetical protein